MRKLQSIQVLRGIAASAVVVTHAQGNQLGAAGVDLFFVISGFIMATVSVGRTPAEFFAARIRRIYPLYWICSLAPLIAGWAVISGAQLVSTATLWPVYPGAVVFPRLPTAWTLCFEMLFYVGCAAALATSWRVPVALFVAAFVANFIFDVPLLRFTGNPLILEFMGGVVLARAPRHAALSKWLLCPALLLLVLAPIDAIANAWQWVGTPLLMLFRVGWYGLPALAICYAALCHNELFNRPIFWPAVLLGDASYSIYLSHAIPNHLFAFGWAAQTALLMAIGIAVYLLVERGLLRPSAFGLGIGKRPVSAAGWRSTPAVVD